MTWVKIDDHLHAHPKFRAAWEMDRASVGLELFALSYSGAFLTDGAIDEPFVGRWFNGGARARDRAVEALVESGLWIPDGAGWQIHDYLDYNEPRNVVEARRRAKEERRQANRRAQESRR